MSDRDNERIIYQITRNGFGVPQSIAIWNGKSFCSQIERARVYPNPRSARIVCPRLFEFGRTTRVGTKKEFLSHFQAIESLKAIEGRTI